MTGIVGKKRLNHRGRMVSLCGLGYCDDVGLLDADVWQDCGDAPTQLHSCTAAPGMHYHHDSKGNPMVNETKIPISIQYDCA
eukprot:CAMPEP_0194038734 /NCGR_PEP_ID=MMETSP0009_2-20130614/10941_1 /TAXON_ID=210454 /ORGANISM="Grammatophora oceanica, Strain CCMP 410" /LENGTH=81 /DNA_ID=CAMNT_0038681329 /DNA_START=89 /DNA_END=334 /DNA_ORIENTATION=+